MSLFDQIGRPTNAQDALRRLQQDPRAALSQAGLKVPDNLMGNPQAIVQHLIQSGQVGGPALQQVLPMIRKLTGK